MAHEISEVDGIAEAFYAGEPAWHRLGTVVKEAPNSEEAIKLAHLEWEVEQVPLYLPAGELKEDPDSIEVSGRFRPVPERVANVRSDNRRLLGVVSDDYKPIQNRDAFRFVDGLVQDGIVKYESAGALKDGKLVWLLGRMPDFTDRIAAGDEVHRYILFTTAHDGTRAAMVLPTSVRVVCWNTLTLALGMEQYRRYRITHTGDPDQQLVEAREVLGIAGRKFEAFAENARRLAEVRVNAESFIDYLDEVVPMPAEGNGKPRQRIRERIMDLYTSDPRQTMQQIKGSAWAAYNSISQYVDHEMGRGQNRNRLYSMWLGHGAEVKELAWGKAVEMYLGDDAATPEQFETK